LPIIKNIDENKAVQDLLPKGSSSTWLAAKKEKDQFSWVDGTKISSFTNWIKGDGNNKVGIILLSDSGKWKSENHDEKVAYTVCQRANETSRLLTIFEGRLRNKQEKIDSVEGKVVQLIHRVNTIISDNEPLKVKWNRRSR